MHRKRNRLADYPYSQPGAYFLTVCTKDRKCLLSTVGADAHIGPDAAPTPVGADAHIGPKPLSTPIPILQPDPDPTAPHPVLTPVGAVAEKYLRSIPGIGAYVIMPNHIHLMLHISAGDVRRGPMWASAPTRADVSGMIRSWKTLVTKELGQSIWQRSYYDHVIRDEQDYLRHLRYIAENPAKWMLDDYYSVGTG